MKTRTKLIALELLGGIFDLLWIGASGAFVYFLYWALIRGELWPYLGWSVAIGVIAQQIAAALKDKKQLVDYLAQLTERGYEREEAKAAWRIASNGGMNLLRNLQQAELGEQVERLEPAIGTATLENSGE
jgi:hypothetical protein